MNARRALPSLLVLAAACATDRSGNPAGAPAQAASGFPVPSGGESGAAATAPVPVPSIAERTRGHATFDGFVPLCFDAVRGRLLLELPHADEELLYVVGLPAGVGSNRIGLDRGQLGPQHVVRFERFGPRVLLVAPNLTRRTSDASAVAQQAVRDSFAASVLWGFDVAAETDGRVLVDATDFLLRDAHGVARRIAAAGQGEVKLDASRSAVWLAGTRAFPDNTELEALLTFVGDEPGPELVATAADPRAVSVRVRHSFVRLPELGTYAPRAFDPRGGFFTVDWTDGAARPDRPARRQVIQRHRLERGGEPITYYVDRAAPEPVRTALVEGARYWEPVFAKAGFPGGFRVELLPADADPLDARYNVIQWVHRSTRGWSYGTTVADPRTGEILKGHVSLGALRVRQDVMLAEGLLSPYEDGRDEDPRVLATALARIRQLAAHEVGHTLGLEHNFAASVAERASVMDYPPPRVLIRPDGTLDLSEAYAPGCGAWDELAIRYGYAELDEERLAAHLRDMERSGIAYLSDADARGTDRAHPLANLWDDGADPIAGLEHALEVRRIALERFSRAAIRPGEPEARLEELLVPLYFHHRYQLEAAARQLGGVSYRHAVRGGEPADVRPVAAVDQWRALAVVRRSVAPEVVALPERVLALLPPPAPGSDPAAERFDDASHVPDPVAIEADCVALTLELLLDPVRAARMVDQAERDPDQPGFDDVCAALVAEAWGRPFEAGPARGELRTQLIDRFVDLARRADVPARVQRVAEQALDDVSEQLARSRFPNEAREAYRRMQADTRRIRHFREDPLAPWPAPRRHAAPPGSPIGASGCGPE